MFDKKKRGELVLQPGDQVWLSTTNVKMMYPSKKLAPKYVGPFPVRRKINDVSYELTLPESFRIHPVFHIKKNVHNNIMTQIKEGNDFA